MSDPQTGTGIILPKSDDNWKQEAQAYKQRITEAAKKPAAPAAAQGLPTPTVASLVAEFANQALLCLGLSPDPSGKRFLGLAQAQHHIQKIELLLTITMFKRGDRDATTLSKADMDLIITTHKELMGRISFVINEIRQQGKAEQFGISPA